MKKIVASLILLGSFSMAVAEPLNISVDMPRLQPSDDEM